MFETKTVGEEVLWDGVEMAFGDLEGQAKFSGVEEETLLRKIERDAIGKKTREDFTANFTTVFPQHQA